MLLSNGSSPKRWGVRLPTTSRREFLDWCKFDVTDTHTWKQTADVFSSLRDLGEKPMVGSHARTILELPDTGDLTASAIKAAYKTATKKAHPDLGGTAEQMTRLSGAKDTSCYTSLTNQKC